MSPFTPLIALVDAPARGALSLSHTSLWRSLGLIVCGAGMVLLSTAVSAALGVGGFAIEGTLAAAIAQSWIEALVVVIPSAVLLFTYANIAFDARATTAAVAVALVTSGIVALGIVPLVAYLVVMTRVDPLVSVGAVPTIVALVAFAATFRRVGVALDRSRRALVLVHGALVAFGAAFVLRLAGHVDALKEVLL
jgi:hypothetical protein